MADLGTVDDTAALRQLLQEALDEFDDDNDVLEHAPPAAGVPSGPADVSGVAYAFSFSTPPRRLLAEAGQHAKLSGSAGVARGAAGVAGAADDDEAECTPSPAQPPPVRTRAPKGGYRPRQLFSNEQPVVLRADAGDGAWRVTGLLHGQLVRGDTRARQLDAGMPAAQQLALFAAVGWPDGLPSASFFKDRAVQLAEERHIDDLNRISARHPDHEVHFPKTIEQFANAQPDAGSEWGDPVYWLTRAVDEAVPDEQHRFLELLSLPGGELETVEQREAVALAICAEAARLAAADAARRPGGSGDDGGGGGDDDGFDGDPQDSCLGGFYGGRRFGGDAFDGGTGD